MRDLPEMNTERIEYTQDQIDKVFRFETPDTLPFFFQLTDQDFDASRNRFVDAHMVEEQLTTWGNWDKTLDRSLEAIRWWNEQQYSPLQWPASLFLSFPQETMLTAFGVKYRLFDGGSIEIDWRDPVLVSLEEDFEKLKELRQGWLNRGLMPDLMEKLRYNLEETGRRIPIGIPDWQSPLGLASKLIGSTSVVYAMIDEPERLRRILDFCADLILDLVKEFERICGDKNLVRSGMCLPRGARGILYDDYVSIITPGVYQDLAVEPNDKVFEYLGGGEMHTCGPCAGLIAESIMAHQHLVSFDFFFVTPDKTRTTSQLLELKRQCHGRVVFNVLGMVFDSENFTVDFVRQINEDGGVIFSMVQGSERQIRQWFDVIEKATAG